MRFTLQEFNSFRNSLYQTVNFLLGICGDVLNTIFKYPMVATVFFFFVLCSLAFLVWQFIIWASDFKLKKNNIYGVTKKYVKSGRYKKDIAKFNSVFPDTTEFMKKRIEAEKPKKVYKPEVVKVPKVHKSSANIDVKYDEG